MINRPNIESIIAQFEDWAEEVHEDDCAYMGNHKGALTWYDHCNCRMGDSLRAAVEALDDCGLEWRKMKRAHDAIIEADLKRAQQ